MEKRSPHCKLSVVKTLIEAGKVRTTQTARAGAVALGFDYHGMLAVVLALKPAESGSKRHVRARPQPCQ
jgi:motility quorum-sensing regulator/GCU-specific mRNA interferase toxin